MAYKWRALIVVCFGTWISTMDFSIVNIALPTLSREFDVDPGTVVWLALAFSLMVTGITLTAGRAGDLFGRKRVYLIGWVLFPLGLALASFAQTFWMLVAARIVQSVGVAFGMTGTAIITEAFPVNERGRALGLSAATIGAGMASGPVLGGLILGFADWRAIYYLRIPFGLIAFVLALTTLRETGGQEGDRRLDLPGALALFVALSSAIIAVNRGQGWGWTSPGIVGLIGAFVVGVATFIRVEARAVNPVISLALFKTRAFAAPVISLMLNSAGQTAYTFLMPFYLVKVRGYSTAHAGLVMTTVPVIMLAISPLSGWLSDRFGSRLQVSAGVVCMSAGLLFLSTLGADTSTPSIVLRLAFVGAGSSLFVAPNNSSIMGSVPRTMLGTAAGSLATSRNVGSATGVALASAVFVAVASSSAGVLTGSGADALPPFALLDGIRMAFIVAAAFSSVAVVATLFRPAQTPVAMTAAAIAPGE